MLILILNWYKEEPLRGRQFKTVGKRDRFAEKRSGTETEQVVKGKPLAEDS